MTDAGQALARQTAPSQEKTIHDLIDRQLPAIERALPQAIGAERFTRLVLTELRRTPTLYDCEPHSLLGAMMLSAQLGLEPGPLGHVYLVPFKRECTFILGYTGLIELARRSGKIRDIYAATVFEGDLFEFEHGTSPKLRHKPVDPPDRGETRCYYAVARFSPAGHVFQVMFPTEIEKHKQRSPMGKAGKGAWATDFDAMARKTCVRALRPYLPLAPVAGLALAADERIARFDEREGDVVVEAVEE